MVYGMSGRLTGQDHIRMLLFVGDEYDRVDEAEGVSRASRGRGLSFIRAGTCMKVAPLCK